MSDVLIFLGHSGLLENLKTHFAVSFTFKKKYCVCTSDGVEVRQEMELVASNLNLRMEN